MTRIEAANLIAQTVEAADYQTDVWAPEGSSGPVRVYLTIPAASYKKKARKIGYIEVAADGSLVSELDLQFGTIMSSLPEMAIEPVIKVLAGSAPVVAGVIDEDVAQHQVSLAATAAAESAREIG